MREEFYDLFDGVVYFQDDWGFGGGANVNKPFHPMRSDGGSEF